MEKNFQHVIDFKKQQLEKLIGDKTELNFREKTKKYLSSFTNLKEAVILGGIGLTLIGTGAYWVQNIRDKVKDISQYREAQNIIGYIIESRENSLFSQYFSTDTENKLLRESISLIENNAKKKEGTLGLQLSDLLKDHTENKKKVELSGIREELNDITNYSSQGISSLALFPIGLFLLGCGLFSLKDRNNYPNGIKKLSFKREYKSHCDTESLHERGLDLLLEEISYFGIEELEDIYVKKDKFKSIKFNEGYSRLDDEINQTQIIFGGGGYR
jgi:hypothetical protein